MQFDNIEHLLKWFFQRRYLNRPKEPGNHSPDFLQGHRRQNTEDSFLAILKIKPVIQGMSFREKSLIQQYYTGVHISIIARRRGYSDRTIRRALERINDDLTRTFKGMGLLGKDLRNPIDDYYSKEDV